MSFTIVIFFEQHQQFLDSRDNHHVGCLCAQGMALRKVRLAGWSGTLTQKIESFKTLSYDSFLEFEDGTIVGICPVVVTYGTSAKTVSRNASVETEVLP